MGHAEAGHRLAIERAAALADRDGAAVRSGPGWLAVRSGAASNDLNAVISTPGFVPDSGLLEDLEGWWDDVPASWLVAEPHEALTQALVEAGWDPERTGRWCGRALDTDHPVAGVASIEAVGGDEDLECWLDVATECGWIEGDDERLVRRDLLRSAYADPREAIWLARLDGQPVGMARGWCSASDLEVVDVAVREAARRRGVGTALVSTVLTWGASRGALDVVAAPSPDGWRLFESLGFDNVPVVPDVCFHWSGWSQASCRG